MPICDARRVKREKWSSIFFSWVCIHLAQADKDVFVLKSRSCLANCALPDVSVLLLVDMVLRRPSLRLMRGEGTDLRWIITTTTCKNTNHTFYSVCCIICVYMYQKSPTKITKHQESLFFEFVSKVSNCPHSENGTYQSVQIPATLFQLSWSL